MAASKKPATTKTLSPQAKAAAKKPAKAPTKAPTTKTATTKAAAARRQTAALDTTATGAKVGGDVYVALMRGINVGGNNMILMKDLSALFTGVGCSDVRTYIQSGNVVFRASAAVVKGLHAAVERALVTRFGAAVPLVLRSQAELAECARSNPYFTKDADPARLVVMFLDRQPSAAEVATLDPARSPPDEFVVRGRDIYLRCPNGLGRSKLTNAWFDGKLKAVSTGRNWNTVIKLLAMCAE